MVYISHRGNINGSNPLEENKPNYIDKTLNMEYDVEIDLWFIENKLYFGHDKPTYLIKDSWIKARNEKLWIHCKNTNCLNYLQSTDLNYFWHEKDTVTLTSKKYIWAYPGKQIIKNSIAVMPEIFDDNITECIGICSDHIEKYKRLLST